VIVLSASAWGFTFKESRPGRKITNIGVTVVVVYGLLRLLDAVYDRRSGRYRLADHADHAETQPAHTMPTSNSNRKNVRGVRYGCPYGSTN
jgi:hypothetical protein